MVIAHGHIVDGTGSPWYAGDVGIRDGRIAAIGDLTGAEVGRGFPGFVGSFQLQETRRNRIEESLMKF